jgi:O-antigen/teichoic acid export membrane protein
MSQLKYMIQRLRVGIIIATVSLVGFFALNFWEGGVCYLVGFLSGCLNFVFLTLSISIVTSIRYKKPVLVQRLFLIVRYLLIVNILIRTVNPNAIGIVLFCIGFLSVNFSVIISSYKFKLNTREEG